MTTLLPEVLAPEGTASRQQVEAALRRHAASVRFVGWTLTEISLARIDFQGCEFVRCRGGHADFSFCDLTDARFSACDFNNSLWHRAILSAAAFQDCKLTGAQIVDARTLGLTFERCLLVSAQLHIDFHGADLSEADFRDAVLMNCNLREAGITGARFDGADLRGADLGELRLLDAPKFKGAIISMQQAALLLSGLGLKVF
jgi:uncharacterized protein YjbI with pentapeptide repeats